MGLYNLAVLFADRKPVLVSKGTPLRTVALTMLQRHRYHSLLIDDSGMPWGVISIRDVAKALFIEGDEGLEVLEAGSLGKVLENPAYYYATHPVITAPKNISLSEAVGIMASNNIGCLPLLDENTIVGVLDERSLSRALPEYTTTNVCELASWDPIHIEKDEEIIAAVGLMLSLGVRRLLVKENNDIMGMISLNIAISHVLNDESIKLLLSGERGPIEDPVEKITVKPWIIDCSYSLRETASIINFDPLGAVLIYDDEKQRIGILTERDLLIALANELIK